MPRSAEFEVRVEHRLTRLEILVGLLLLANGLEALLSFMSG